MASAALNRFSVLSHQEVRRFYPPGTRVELESNQKAGKVDSYDDDGWIWVAEIPGNDLRLRKTYDLNPCVSRGMWVLVRSKHILSRPYKIARITETSAKNRTVAVKLLSGFSQVLSRPCIREVIPFNRSHADLVARLTGSEIPVAFFASEHAAPAGAEAELEELASVDQDSLEPKLRHVRDLEGKSYPYLLYPDGRIGWFGFEETVESHQGKRNAPADELQEPIRKKK